MNNMNPLQLELTRLIGKKELTFGCMIRIKFEYLYKVIEKVDNKIYCLHPITIDRNKAIQEVMMSSIDGNRNEIIGHPVTLFDLHNWMNNHFCIWTHDEDFILIGIDGYNDIKIEYDRYEDILDQDDETLNKIIHFITLNQ